jgi:flagellar biosynthesis anti-sigma factor FlgM
MRIDSNFGPQSVPENNRSTTESASAAGNASANSTSAETQLGSDPLGTDQAQLSGVHLQVQALAAQAAQLPEVRQERVSALRQAVLGGNYDTTPEQTAGALLGHMIIAPAA